MEGLREDTHCNMSHGKQEGFYVFVLRRMLTSDDVEHSGVEDGRADQS